MYDQWCSADNDHLVLCVESHSRGWTPASATETTASLHIPGASALSLLAFSCSGETSPASHSWRNFTKESSQRQLICDGVLLYDSYESIILYAFLICHVTRSVSWTTKHPDMTFYSLLNVYLEPEACDAKGNGPDKRNEVKTNAKMTQQTSWSHFPPLWTQLTALI